MPTPEEKMFAEALSAIDAGERARALDLLTRLLKTGKENPDYWLWMSVVVESPKERTFCLKEALRLDPENAAARRGLAMLGTLPPNPSDALPAQYFKRGWQKQLFPSENVEKVQGSKIQFVAMGVALVVLLLVGGLVIWGTQMKWGRQRVLNVSNLLPTSTITPTEIVTPTYTATVSGSPTPLWMLLEATYTPTPLYVNTPHAVSESYRIAMRAYHNREWDKAITYFQQAERDTSSAPDVIYYLGEVYRQQANYSRAIKEFDRLIENQPDFAAAYLGRARARLASDPEAVDEIVQDLQTAVQKDPQLSEAYLELAFLQAEGDDPSQALSSLDMVSAGQPDSALVFLYRARILLRQGEAEQALESARRANQLDITLLEAYRVLGEALQASGDLPGSIEPLSTYVTYETGDALAWSMLAKAYLAEDQNDEALEALNNALALKAVSPEALLARGEILLEEGMAEKALNDFQAVLRTNPKSFAAHLGAGRALMDMDYPGDAWKHFEESMPLAKTNGEKAERLFWLAQSLEVLDEPVAAINRWKDLLALPEEDLRPEWARMAETRIQALYTRTPTAKPKTPTFTPTRTSTRWPTKTPTATITRKPTLTPVPSSTPKPLVTMTMPPTPTRKP